MLYFDMVGDKTGTAAESLTLAITTVLLTRATVGYKFTVGRPSQMQASPCSRRSPLKNLEWGWPPLPAQQGVQSDLHQARSLQAVLHADEVSWWQDALEAAANCY